MPHAASRRPVAFSFALLAWVLAAVAAHSHGHQHTLLPDDSGEQIAGAAIDSDYAQHSSSPALASASHDLKTAGLWTASADGIAMRRTDGAASRRRQLLRTVSAGERTTSIAASVHVKLAAAAKADIAAKALRTRKAGMYPGSPARRALAEDPNQAVRCAAVVDTTSVISDLKYHPTSHLPKRSATAVVCPEQHGAHSVLCV